MSFTWTPDFGASKEVKPTVSKIQFGEGYAQRYTQGMNTTPSMWSLTFSNRSESEAQAIDDYLKEKGGVLAFEWTPPLETTPISVVCSTWNKNIVRANLATITATFEQVYEPV
jgi:phage-related protein